MSPLIFVEMPGSLWSMYSPYLLPFYHKIYLFQNVTYKNHTRDHFLDWVISINNMYCNFFHTFSWLHNPFSLFLNNISPFQCITYFIFLYLSIEYFTCFQVLVVVSKAVISTCVYIFLWIYILTSLYEYQELLNHM